MNSAWWAAIVALVWVPVVIGLEMDRRERVQLQRTVSANLDAAAENGYFEPGGQWNGATAEQIAYDTSGDLVTLTPYVCEWLREKGRT